MDFEREQRINYDPHRLISQRKQSNKNKPFDRQFVEGLYKIANLSRFEKSSRIDKGRRNESIAAV